MVMPARKSTRVKTPVSGKRPIGLTSALGPKATTMVVIGVMAGGILVAARQQSRPKDAPLVSVASEMGPVVKPASTKGAAVNVAYGEPAAAPVAVSSTAAAAVPAAPPVTITGCLERNDDTFRLKDTSGTNAPKSRSWKSGFLKKGSAAIEVVDAARTLKLADQVGHRVSVTGTLVDRQMRVRSLRRVSASCDDRPGA
jgi:hypothetical protein